MSTRSKTKQATLAAFMSPSKTGKAENAPTPAQKKRKRTEESDEGSEADIPKKSIKSTKSPPKKLPAAKRAKKKAVSSDEEEYEDSDASAPPKRLQQKRAPRTRSSVAKTAKKTTKTTTSKKKKSGSDDDFSFDEESSESEFSDVEVVDENESDEPVTTKRSVRQKKSPPKKAATRKTTPKTPTKTPTKQQTSPETTRKSPPRKRRFSSSPNRSANPSSTTATSSSPKTMAYVPEKIRSRLEALDQFNEKVFLKDNERHKQFMERIVRDDAKGKQDNDSDPNNSDDHADENKSLHVADIDSDAEVTGNRGVRLVRFKMTENNSTESNTASNAGTKLLIPTIEHGFRNRKKTNVKYTPLESQVISLKERYPDVVIFVECGYKYKFYGEDAAIASQLLNILARVDHNFLTASIPKHRLSIHLRRVVDAGYKAGVVRQTETAAIKKSGSSRSQPFSRDLTAMYTKGTMIPDDDFSSSCGHLVCVMEDSSERVQFEKQLKQSEAKKLRTKQQSGSSDCDADNNSDQLVYAPENVQVTMLAVNVSTGEILYDHFEDKFMRRELDARLCQLQPIAELLIPSNPSAVLSKQTENLIAATSISHGSRVERIDAYKFVYEYGFDRLVELFSDKKSSTTETVAADVDTNDSEVNSKQKKSSTKKTTAKGKSNTNQSKAKAGLMKFVDSKPTDVEESNNNNSSSSSSSSRANMERVEAITKTTPASVITCLGVVIDYLRSFGLENVLRLTGNFKRISSINSMALPASTLKNLELLRNAANGEEKGSLFALLNHTRTSFGTRLLKHWLCHPLQNAKEVSDRLEAVSELSTKHLRSDSARVRAVQTQQSFFASLYQLFGELPDLERGLLRAYYRKCSPKELLSVLKAFQRLCKMLPNKSLEEYEAESEDSASAPFRDINSELLRDIVTTLGTLNADTHKTLQSFLDSFAHDAAEKNRKADLFLRSEKYPEIKSLCEQLEECQQELSEHLREIQTILKAPTFAYKSVLNLEFVIELTKEKAKSVPKDWKKISETKTVTRFHTPLIIETLKVLNLHRERLEIESSKKWEQFLGEFAEQYGSFRTIVDQIAVLDCLFSLAEVSRRPNYTKPIIIDSNSEPHQLIIKDGRHPIVETLIPEPYVPNSIEMTANGERCSIITGPNMGGKSSYIKQMALIVIMAQMGCFVPAAYAKLGCFDAIYTRMGASDNISEGSSTFLVELSEASEILQKSTPRSLVVLDELGRGTSTHDGTAIAYATLRHIVEEIKCFALFVTHYPTICTLEQTSAYPGSIGNYHMAFLNLDYTPSVSQTDEDFQPPQVTFLYKVVQGISDRSFGLNVARLAGIPESALEIAAEKSLELEQLTIARQREYYRKQQQQLGDADTEMTDAGSTDVVNETTEADIERFLTLYNALEQQLSAI